MCPASHHTLLVYPCILDPHSSICTSVPFSSTFELYPPPRSVRYKPQRVSWFFPLSPLLSVVAHTFHVNKLRPTIQYIYPCKSVNSRWYSKYSFSNTQHLFLVISRKTHRKRQHHLRPQTMSGRPPFLLKSESRSPGILGERVLERGPRQRFGDQFLDLCRNIF